MHYHIYYNIWKLKCIDGNLNWFVLGYLCELIKND